MTSTIIIVTLNRPDCVQRCLQCLYSQEPRPDQIIVVDASGDDKTQRVVDTFPAVLYLRNDNGYGRMTASRNIGLKLATGEVIAFLDDDAFAHPSWLSKILSTYTDNSIGAVGGRVLNNQPGEALHGVNEIGKLKSNGELTGYFAADPGKVVEVDHVMGCNMSFRRAVVARLGGFREDYPGISGVREDSDMCLRVKKLGFKILFNPSACVDHIGAPQAKGKRFDLRYNYYAQRNHTVMLIRNFGLLSEIVTYYFPFSVYQSFRDTRGRRLMARLVRLAVTLLGAVVGVASGTFLLFSTGRDPVRRDPEGKVISKILSHPSV